MKKRFWALLLAVMMVVSVLPTAAFAEGGANSLTPDPVTDADNKVKISKTATRTGADTYEITLTVKAIDDEIKPEPLELVLLLDVSGSMTFCVRKDWICHHSYRGECPYTNGDSWYKQEKPRIQLAGEAAKTLVADLQEEGINASVSVVTFASNYSGAKETDVKKSLTALTSDNLNEIIGAIPSSYNDALGGTHTNAGLLKANEQFSGDTSNKVIVLLSDGDYDEGTTNPTGENGAVQKTLMPQGVKVHTIGFTTTNRTLQTIASQTGGKYYEADDEKALAAAFKQIATSLTAMVEDDMGSDVQLVGTPTADNGGSVQVVDGALKWNPANGMIESGRTDTITYTVQIKESALVNGSNSIDLNGEAVLTYSIGNDTTTKTLEFPTPTDIVEVGKLTVKVTLNGKEYEAATVIGDDTIVYNNNTFDLTYPADGHTITVDGITYTYADSTYDGEASTAATAPVTAGEHTLIHRYTYTPAPQTVTVTYTDGVDGQEVFEDQVTTVNINTAPTAFDGDTTTLTYTDANNDKYIFVRWDPVVAQTVSKDTVYTAQWEKDNWHDANPNDPADKDSDKGGDRIPDKYQVLVKYKSKDVNKGTVTPEYEVITLTNGEVLLDTANVRVSGSTAAPKDGYSFEKWTDNGDNTVTETIDGETTNVGPVLPAQTIKDAVGGTTYTYTAYWTENVPNLSVEKTVASVGGVEVDYTAASVNIPTAKVGDTIVWNITVTNSGNAAGSATLVDSIEGVKIYSVTDSGIKTELTGAALTITVPVNGSLSYVAEYTVTTADKGKTLSNKITLSDNDDETETDPSATAPDVKVENIDVEKVLTGIYAPNSTTAKTGTTAEVGDTIKWTIKVTNNGDEDVTIGTPTDVLTVDGDPVDSSLVTISTSAVDSDGKYTIPGKAEGQDASSIVFTVEYTVRAEDLNKQISNSATVNGVSDTADDTVNVGATPGLSVTKTVNKTSVTVGDKIIYTITVKNTGNVDLTNVKVEDTFVDGGTGKLTVKAGDMKIGTLAVGEEAKIELEYTTTSDDRNGLKNTAMATANGVEGKSSSVDVTVKSEPITPVGPSKPQLNYEDHYAYVVGYPDGLVHPERNITRAEVATIFFRMLLDESREYFWAQENDFSDVAETDWFNNAVSTLANAQLINGYPDGSYRPNANITRAEFATIAIRFFLDEDVEIEENNLSDVKGHWAEANINLAYALELINGYPDGTFRPDQKITRAEAMAIVNRVLKRAPEKDHLLKDMIEWPDNLNTAAWYYADVQEATNSHKFHMDKEEEYEIWTELLPVRDWVALEQEWSKANSSKNPGEVVDIKITTPEAGDNGLKLD